MRIAITGATGNAGTALLRRLARAKSEEGEDLQIVGISRRHPESLVPPYLNVEWHDIDVGKNEDLPRLEEAFAGADAVVHLAWTVQPNRQLNVLYQTNVVGTANALEAAGRTGVRQFVCASSLGAYSKAEKDKRINEDYPVDGIAGSHYSEHKAQQEALLDRFETGHPEVAVARLRPGLIFQRDAGSEVGKYFLGRLIPRLIPSRPSLPLLPVPKEFIFQAVHADDIAEAYWLVLKQRAFGAFNIAAEPVVDPNALGWLLGAKRILPIPVALLRAVVDLSWRARLQPTDPGWVDMATWAPIMDTSRAREQLGWKPTVSSLQAIKDLIYGLGSGAGVDGSPPLRER